MTWHAPQWIMAGMLTLSVLFAWILHGRNIRLNAWPKLVDAMLVAIILYWGGFWN